MSTTEAEAGIDSEAFKHVVGHLTSGVTVVTGEANGTRFGMTASSVTSLSVKPPMMLVCINRSAPTADAILRARYYTINVLGVGQEDLARQFAIPSPDKFRGVRVAEGRLGGPVLSDALASIECEVEDSVTAGTHAIFIGRVADAIARVGEPLAYFRGGFGRFQHVDDEDGYRAIRGMILGNRWGSGAKQCDEIAETLGIEASVVFHALTRLGTDGLVAWDPNRGYVLTELDPRLVESAADARCAMELGVVDVSLPQADDAEIAEVRQRFDEMEPLLVADQFLDIDAFFDAHAAFHRAIMALSRNTTLVSAFDGLDLQQLMVRGLQGSHDTSDAFIRVQADLMVALEGRDVSAARHAILRYANMVRTRVRSLLPLTSD
ncbi:flavin reductase [uncultured Jatrophihabitans sp.]|uniref:flavin reductase n=1 Tax=uncultured Jatrophihabitans sp. TaxID=1610747 RepID=UPI0035CC479A